MGKSNWRKFEEARIFVHQLNLKSKKEWSEWTKKDVKPDDLPSDPRKAYLDKGWNGWGDWLGTGTVASFNRIYPSFEEARDFAHQLQLKSKNEWSEWAKSDLKPDYIPADPFNAYKDKGWNGWGDWLGTGTIAPFNRSYRSYEEARNYVHLLRLKNKKEWSDWSKSDKKAVDIPANPTIVYKDKGWNGWGDWLGTGTIAPFNRSYRSYEEARDYVHLLRLKNKEEWVKWAKTELRPHDIPADCAGIYKNQGWLGWGDWLGTGTIANRNREYRSFEESRIFAHSLDLKDIKEWKIWSKTDAKPSDIPAIPSGIYKNDGWISWGDWLGTSTVANQNRIYRSFEEAREFTHQLQLKSKNEWSEWAKSDSRPADIPADPANVYKDQGWNGWGDWFGTGTVASFNRIYKPFEEAQNYVRSLGLKSDSEWKAWSKTAAKPKDIPATPERVYKNHGWNGLGDWLGITNRWIPNSILSFLYSLKPILKSLEPSELYAIMRQNGMTASIRKGRRNAEFLENIKNLCSSIDLDTDCNSIISLIEEELSKGNSESDETELDDWLAENNVEDIEELESGIVPNEIENTNTELPQLPAFDCLKAVDLLVEAGITSDHETIEFLICNRVSALWQACLNNDPTFDLDRLRNETGGTYFQTIRDRFLSQHDGAANLTIPNGYNFPYPPNLMQRLTAYRILTERRIGNWSGVGAGKTISAIFASRVINAKFTIIIAFNSTIEGWAKAIAQVYPDSIIYQKERGEISVDRNQHNYLILNFEKFQQPYSAELVGNLTFPVKYEFEQEANLGKVHVD